MSVPLGTGMLVSDSQVGSYPYAGQINHAALESHAIQIIHHTAGNTSTFPPLAASEKSRLCKTLE